VGGEGIAGREATNSVYAVREQSGDHVHGSVLWEGKEVVRVMSSLQYVSICVD
jgi:hypothetical protein